MNTFQFISKHRGQAGPKAVAICSLQALLRVKSGKRPLSKGTLVSRLLTPWPERLEHPKMFRYLPQSGASPLWPVLFVWVLQGWSRQNESGKAIALACGAKPHSLFKVLFYNQNNYKGLYVNFFSQEK